MAYTSNLKNLEKELAQKIKMKLPQAEKVFHKKWDDIVPVKTGKLKAGYRASEVIKRGDVFRIELSNDESYALDVEMRHAMYRKTIELKKREIKRIFEGK